MIINGDCISVLKSIDDKTINCCVTSPPYYQLRDYGNSKQIGLEATPYEYIEKLVAVFREVKRVLKDDGTLWINIGDSYSGSGKGAAHYTDTVDGTKQASNSGLIGVDKIDSGYSDDIIKPKDLIGIPWMLAFALRADGWYLRQDIIWAKPNPMPESVKDRCTKSHEYIFLLSKSKNYYYDAESIAEQVADSSAERYKQDIENQKGSERVPGKTNGTMKAVLPRYGGKKYTENPDVFNRTKSGNAYEYRLLRNKRDVWNVSTKPYREAHFATFPKDLIDPCILAGCPVGGTVLDPFCGSGTTGEVATEHQRNFVGIELNERYCRMAENRIDNTQIKLEFAN